MLALQSCSDLDDISSLELEGVDAEYAFPVINSTIRIKDIIDSSDETVSARVDVDGKVILNYSGEVLRQDVSEIFPAYPGVIGIPVTDTSFILPLPLAVNFTIIKSVFKNSNAILTIVNTTDDVLDINVTLPDLQLDDVPFRQSVVLQAGESFISGPVSILGYTLLKNFDEIEITYDARNPAGERVLLDNITFGIDWLSFQYAEGYFGSRVYDIQADVIPVGIFEPWESGGIDFSDPKVTLKVDNAFGFPVQTVVNQLELITLSDQVRQVESDFIDEGIIFNYPAFDQVGEIAKTDFAFDESNSNINILFNERVKQVRFDIDALAFPNQDDGTIGFVTDSSFFAVNVAVELPLLGTIDDLVISDIFDFDIGNIEEEIRAAEFKLILNNSFPMAISLDAYLLDDDEQELVKITDTPITLVAANSSIANGTQFTEDQISIIDIDESELNLVRQASKIQLRLSLGSPDNMDNPVWLLEEYGLKTKLGAKIKVVR